MTAGGFRRRLPRSPVCIEPVPLPVVPPGLVQCLEFDVADNFGIPQSEQGRAYRDPGDIGLRHDPAPRTSQSGWLDSSRLTNEPSSLGHLVTECRQLLPGHRSRPPAPKLFEHLGKPDSLCITGGHGSSLLCHPAPILPTSRASAANGGAHTSSTSSGGTMEQTSGTPCHTRLTYHRKPQDFPGCST